MSNKSEKVDWGRRALLAGAGAATGLALTREPLLFADRYRRLSYSEALSALEASLNTAQKEATLLPWDHPMRQVTNTSAVHQGPHISTLYNGQQLALINRIYETTLSSTGREWFRATMGLEGRLSGSTFKIYTDRPKSFASANNTQTVINGGHHMLRGGASGNSPTAFGGPIAYGQQLGNGQFKVQGNAFKAHGDAVDTLHRALSVEERQAAYLNEPPMELVNQVLGEHGRFPGVRIGRLSIPAQEVAQQTLATLFAAYPEHEQRHAFAAIQANGGIAALHLALYNDYGFYANGQKASELTAQQRQAKGLHYAQVWRIEGPACVIHFKGYPHVHAYINVVNDPQRMAVGEQLASLGQPLLEPGVKAFMQQVLRSSTGEPLAFYPIEVASRLSPGAVSTGSIYALEPFGNRQVVVDIRGERMSAALSASLQQQGITVRADEIYTVATIDYMLRAPQYFGEPERLVSTDGELRLAAIQHIRAHGLA